jgi:hypothetical protein
MPYRKRKIDTRGQVITAGGGGQKTQKVGRHATVMPTQTLSHVQLALERSVWCCAKLCIITGWSGSLHYKRYVRDL